MLMETALEFCYVNCLGKVKRAQMKTIKIQQARVGMYVVAVSRQQGQVAVKSEGWIRFGTDAGAIEAKRRAGAAN